MSDSRQLQELTIRDNAVASAAAALELAKNRAASDPIRPIYHFLPPAHWMNDPNGPLYHNGYYHLFYQHSPFTDTWETMYWGHARSRDLVHWEHLPVALWPSVERGELHCFSGCAARDGAGGIRLIYTSIGKEGSQQWMAVPEDDELICWRKYPANPVLTPASHGDVRITDWRDPFVCEAAGKAIMVVGGNVNFRQGSGGVVNLYHSCNSALTRWKYKGILFRHRESDITNIECPLFFPLQNKWMLVISPQGFDRTVRYLIGDFDVDENRFTPQREGRLDRSTHFFAPNCLQEASGRRVVWGWIKDFPPGRGWSGCLTVPRVLGLRDDGSLSQKPAPELMLLRRDHFSIQNISVTNSVRELEVRQNSLEILLELQRGDSKECGLLLRRSSDGERALRIRIFRDRVEVDGVRAPLPEGPTTLHFHIFLDRSVVEIFTDSDECITRVIEGECSDDGVALYAIGGTATIVNADFWRLDSIQAPC